MNALGSPLIPALTDEGLLPQGVHPCTMKELEDRFGRFQRSDRRIRLTRCLAAYLSELRQAGFVSRVVVDGSYVTSKDEPDDIDLIVVLRSSHDFASNLRPADYNIVSKKRVKKEYGFDVMVVPEDSRALDEYLSFFQRTREGRTKGVLEVQT